MECLTIIRYELISMSVDNQCTDDILNNLELGNLDKYNWSIGRCALNNRFTNVIFVFYFCILKNCVTFWQKPTISELKCYSHIFHFSLFRLSVSLSLFFSNEKKDAIFDTFFWPHSNEKLKIRYVQLPYIFHNNLLWFSTWNIIIFEKSWS